MNIFESLENLNVSEECFDEIMGIVEELLSEGWADILQKNPDKADVIDKVYSAKSGRYGRMPRKDMRYHHPTDYDTERQTIPKVIRNKGLFVKDEEGNRATKATAGSDVTQTRRGKNGSWSYVAQFGKSAKEKKKAMDYDYGGKTEKAYDDTDSINYDSVDNSPQVSSKKLNKTIDRAIERHGQKVTKQLKAKVHKRK